jgi:hypothetical protein
LWQVHILNHFHDRPFRCSQAGCDWSFASSFKLKRHMETHLKRRDFVVRQYLYSAGQYSAILAHLCNYSITLNVTRADGVTVFDVTVTDALITERIFLSL